MKPTTKWLLPAVFWLGACAMAEPVPPGRGEVSRESRERLEAEAAAARQDEVRRACELAGAPGSDARLQRKCARLAGELVSNLRYGKNELEPATVLDWARPALALLERDRCGTKVESAKVYSLAGDPAAAAERYADVARGCRDAEAAVSGAWSLREAKRCKDAVALVGELWPAAPEPLWIKMLDAAAACSDSVTLRKNLSFAPESVREDYFRLLDDRRREEERRQAEYERQRAAQEAEARDRQRRWSCESDCDNARSQCRSSCGSYSSCYSQCDALGSACRSGCH